MTIGNLSHTVNTSEDVTVVPQICFKLFGPGQKQPLLLSEGECNTLDGKNFAELYLGCN